MDILAAFCWHDFSLEVWTTDLNDDAQTAHLSTETSISVVPLTGKILSGKGTAGDRSTQPWIWAHRLHWHRKNKREKEEKEKKREKRFAFLLFKSVYKLFLQAAQLPDEYAYSSKALNSFTSAGIGASGKLVEREKQLSEKNSEVIGFFCLSFWYQHTLRSGKSWCSCAAPFGGTSS